MYYVDQCNQHSELFYFPTLFSANLQLMFADVLRLL